MISGGQNAIEFLHGANDQTMLLRSFEEIEADLAGRIDYAERGIMRSGVA